MQKDTDKLENELSNAVRVEEFLADNKENFKNFTLADFALENGLSVEETNALLQDSNEKPLIGDINKKNPAPKSGINFFAVFQYERIKFSMQFKISSGSLFCPYAPIAAVIASGINKTIPTAAAPILSAHSPIPIFTITSLPSFGII